MRPTRIVALTGFLTAVFFVVGCSTSPPPPTPPGTDPPRTPLDSFELKERFSLETGIRQNDGKPTGTTGIAVSADGKLVLAMASEKAGNVQVWDLEKRKKLYQYDNPNGSVMPVAISPDRKWGAYPTQSSPSIALIDLTNGKEVRQLKMKGDNPLFVFTSGLAFSPKGDLLIAASDKKIIGWDPATGAERFVWTETAEVSALSDFFDDGKKIASGTATGVIKVWDVATGSVVQTLTPGGDNKIGALFVSADGKRLGALEPFTDFKVWDLTTGKKVNEFTGKPAGWCSIRFLPDNRTLVYNGVSALILQDTVTGEMKRFAEADGIYQFPVAVTPDGLTLVSGQSDAKIRVWDLKFAR